MREFIIGTLGVIIVSIVAFFVPSYYSYSWGYANIGSSTGYSETSKQYFSLMDANNIALFLFLVVIILALLLYLILMLTNHSNIVPLSLIFLLAITPFVLIVVTMSGLKQEGAFIEVGDIIIGAGSNAHISGWGILCLVLLLVFYSLIVVGYGAVREKIELKQEKNVEKIKIKKKEENKSSASDFSL